MASSTDKITQLREQERRKIEFQVSTYGLLAEQEQARVALARLGPGERKARAMAVEGGGEGGEGGPEDEEGGGGGGAKGSTVTGGHVGKRAATKSNKKIQRGLERMGQEEDDEDKAPWYARRQQRQLKSLRNKVDIDRMRTAFSEYDGDSFSTRGDYVDGMLYRARMTPAQEHEIRTPWNLKAKADAAALEGEGADGGGGGGGVSTSNNMESNRTAASTLCNLTWNAGNTARMIEEGALPALISLSSLEDRRTQLSCAVAFHNMSKMTETRGNMVDEGAVKALVEMSMIPVDQQLNAMTGTGTILKLHCAAALCNLMATAGREELIVRAGAIEAISMLLRGEDDTTIAICARALYVLVVLCVVGVRGWRRG